MSLDVRAAAKELSRALELAPLALALVVGALAPRSLGHDRLTVVSSPHRAIRPSIRLSGWRRRPRRSGRVLPTPLALALLALALLALAAARGGGGWRQRLLAIGSRRYTPTHLLVIVAIGGPEAARLPRAGDLGRRGPGSRWLS